MKQTKEMLGCYTIADISFTIQRWSNSYEVVSTFGFVRFSVFYNIKNAIEFSVEKVNLS